jgi:hypothetical protein
VVKNRKIGGDLKRNIISLFCLLVFATTGYCGQQSIIQLTDGSVINGEIISLVNGTYIVSTASFGDIKIDSTRVTKIESRGKPDNLSFSQLQDYGQSIMSNPDNASVVQDLANNPQIRALVEDPEIANAVKSGNVQALMNNKKLIDVASSPEIEEAARKIKQ